MSAFFASLSVVLLYFIILLVMRDAGFGIRDSTLRTPHYALIIPAITGSFLFAFSNPLWFYSVVAEVYTLQQVLTSGVLLLSLRWIQRSQLANFRIIENSQVPILIAYSFGISLANHGTSVLLAPALLFVAFSTPYSAFRMKNISFCIFHFALSLTLYLFLPIRSAQDPFLDWGDPETPSRFWWVLSAQEFQQQMVSLKYSVAGGIVGAIPSFRQALHELPLQYGKMILDDFTIFGLLLSFLGVFWLGRNNWRVLVFTGLIFFINLLYGFLFGADLELEAYLLTSHLVFAIWVGCGIYWLVAVGSGSGRKTLLLLTATFFMPFYTLLTHYPERDLSRNEEAKRYIFQVTEGMKEGEIFLTENSVDLFLLYYLQGVEKKRMDIVPVYLPYLRFDWHRGQINSKLKMQNAKFSIEDILTPSNSIDNAKLVYQSPITNHQSQSFTYTPLTKLSLDPQILHPSGFVFKVSNEPISPEVLQHHRSLQENFVGAIHELPLRDADTRRHFRIVHASLGELFFQRGFFEEAEREYEMGIEMDPEDENLRLNLGLVYEKEGRWEDALAEYETIQNSPITNYQLPITKLQSKIHERIGRIHLRSGNPEKSLHHLERALQLSVSDDPTSRSELHYLLGIAYLKMGKIGDAIHHNEEAIRLQPTFVEAYNNLGICYREQNDTEMALKCFEKSIEVDPRYVEGRYNLGMTYFQLGRMEEARSHFQILLKNDPENPQFSEILGLIGNRSN